MQGPATCQIRVCPSGNSDSMSWSDTGEKPMLAVLGCAGPMSGQLQKSRCELIPGVASLQSSCSFSSSSSSSPDKPHQFVHLITSRHNQKPPPTMNESHLCSTASPILGLR
eukprot:TRINITY_DN8502_c0_g2_i1.p1 TRINITY_DN8502_c0_g2~~TRINITY_DN8502_c0_g2_i1.p1  ORF type:complete len:111 (+),score=5.01 TRINITY_DN8502_c0_g2_i1:288-620(+)